jgi:hypothetical protein
MTLCGEKIQWAKFAPSLHNLRVRMTSHGVPGAGPLQKAS